MVILTGIALLAGWKRKVKNESLGLVPVGILSGLLTTSAAIGGPPLVLFFSNQDVEKQVFRANIVAYFVSIHVFSLGVFWMIGLLNMETISRAGTFLIPLLIGTVAGVSLAKHINEVLFRKIVLVMVCVLALVLVISNLSI